MRPTLAVLVPVVAVAAMAPSAGADTFTDTTPGPMAFAVPAGVTSMTVSLTGGAGGDVVNGAAILASGGVGALVTGTIAVFGGEQLQLTVASIGGNANAGTGTNGGAGTPDGGAGGWSAGGGGGATRILDCQGITCSVAVIAAGGGGAGMQGYVSGPSTTLPGGPGGAAGVRGTDGASDNSVPGGGGGGQPGSPSAVGTGGPGGSGGTGGTGAAGDAGKNGDGANGGAGGTPADSGHKGGGGGGGGVFGGGGGGSGGFGMDPSSNQASGGGGGGGGGSSLAPSGGEVKPAAAHATPGIVLTWTAPGSGSGGGSGGGGSGGGTGNGGGTGGGGTATATISKLTLSPSVFRAAASGPSAVAAARRFGARVDYTLNQAAAVSFTVTHAVPGRRASKGRCVKPTRANRKRRRCTRHVLLAGAFARAGNTGANSFRFMGRLAGRRLKPGSYRLVATPTASATGHAVQAAFEITG